MQLIDNIPVWGPPEEGALSQIKTCAKTAAKVALMADHHKGYAVPVTGVVAYKNSISPSGVGYGWKLKRFFAPQLSASLLLSLCRRGRSFSHSGAWSPNWCGPAVPPIRRRLLLLSSAVWQRSSANRAQGACP